MKLYLTIVIITFVSKVTSQLDSFKMEDEKI